MALNSYTLQLHKTIGLKKAPINRSLVRLILAYLIEIIKANPCLQNGPPLPDTTIQTNKLSLLLLSFLTTITAAVMVGVWLIAHVSATGTAVTTAAVDATSPLPLFVL